MKKYLWPMLLFSSCALGSLPTIKFHYKDKVKFSDEFYGECVGEILEPSCGFDSCSYLVIAICDTTTKPYRIKKYVPGERLTPVHINRRGK